MKNTNKGFTLIELLAVIVILAIIALIATPVVLGIIEKAKLRTVEISGLNYVDAIEKQIVSSMLEVDGQINDGVYDYDDIPVSIKGQTPDSGWFEVEKGQVSDYSFVIDGYVVTKGSKTKKGDTAATKPRDGIYILGELIYFDPVSDDKCDENSTSETCYKWRVIETADTKSKPTITLQMDHNLINTIAWSLPDDNQASGMSVLPELNTKAEQMGLPRAKQMAISLIENTTGPVTALTELNEKTKTWLRVEPLTYEYDTSAAESNYGKMSCTDGNCTLNGNAVPGTAMARMITGEEVRDITNTEVTEPNASSKTWTIASSMTDEFYFSGIDFKLGTLEKGQGNTNLAWLAENTKEIDESLIRPSSNGQENYGYWTLSPVSDDIEYAWGVAKGVFATCNIDMDDMLGVRPVITVLKSGI